MKAIDDSDDLLNATLSCDEEKVAELIDQAHSENASILKYNQSAESAITQIKNRHYTDFLKDYSGEILLVGINYDKDDPNKKHTCRIEKTKK